MNLFAAAWATFHQGFEHNRLCLGVGTLTRRPRVFADQTSTDPFDVKGAERPIEAPFPLGDHAPAA